MIKYKVYMNNNANSDYYKKFYARAVADSTVDTDGLANHMAKHNTPFSEGVIKGILIDAITCIKELVLDGKSVKLDNLAIFSAGLQTKPANSPEEFSAQENITNVRLKARATGRLRTAVLKQEAKVSQYGEYKKPLLEKEE